MKAFCTTLLLLCSCVQYSNAQGIFARAAVGYGFPFSGGQSLILDGYPYAGSNPLSPNTPRYSAEGASLNAGMHAQITAGYWFNKNFGADITGDIGLSTKKYSYEGVKDSLKIKITNYAKMPVFLIPSVIWSPNFLDNQLYVKLGAVLPLSNRIYTETNTIAAPTDPYFNKTEMLTKFTVGLYMGVGFNKEINEHFSIFGEAALTAISFETKQSNLTEFTVNGRDEMDSRSQSQKQVIYEEGYVNEPNPDINLPGKASSYRIPFSNLGIKLGVAYNLSTRKEKEEVVE